MYRPALVASLFALSCTLSPKGGDTGTTATEGPGGEAPSIQATVRALDATSGAGVSEVTVDNGHGDIATTASNGAATIPVMADSTFSVLLQKEGAIDHLLFGPTGSEDFEYITYFASEAMVDSVLTMLGINPGPETGVVIVGIDYDDLSPAVGATASIGSAHDSPWILGSMGPTFGNTIAQGAMGMVAFSSVPPGDVSVSVVPPSGADCTAFPGGGEMPAAPVAASQVTVVTFHCR